MSYLERSEIEQIQLALTTSDINILETLSRSHNLNVRRSVARNNNITSKIADELLYDPVMNVSYVASFNPKKTRDRKFDERFLTPCVKCSVEESKLDCSNCAHFVGSVA